MCERKYRELLRACRVYPLFFRTALFRLLDLGYHLHGTAFASRLFPVSCKLFLSGLRGIQHHRGGRIAVRVPYIYTNRKGNGYKLICWIWSLLTKPI